MWLFALFVIIPVIEIGLFIQVGGWLGLWPTLLIVIATAVAGSWLVRNQGLLAMGQIRSSFERLSDPSEPLAHGAMILFSGALLLTPGFFTDTVGLLLLVPAVRSFAFRELKKRIKVQSFSVHSSQTYGRPADEDVIDGDFTDVTPNKQPTHKPVKGPSGWTKH